MNKIKSPKKLIEVALPLDDINGSSAYEKLPGIGAHPRGIHHWWARRPFGAARAVIFSQMVNDPGGARGWGKGLTKLEAEQKREKLFQIVRRLADWKNSDDQELLDEAYKYIEQSWKETCELNKGLGSFNWSKVPPLHDPFAGGGAIPSEAQRIGLDSIATDLNPIPVMINKVMLEVSKRFFGSKPVGPNIEKVKKLKLEDDFFGLEGLSEDFRRYGHLVNDGAKAELSKLYPVESKTGASVVAWIWARTVKSPNPVYSDVDVPLMKSFVLASKKGRETWISPIVTNTSYEFEIKQGKIPDSAKSGTKSSRGANFTCLMSGTPISPAYIKQQASAGGMGLKLVAIVANGKNGKTYHPGSKEHENIALSPKPSWGPDIDIAQNPRHMVTLSYGLTKFSDLFTPRQLYSLDVYSNQITKVRETIRKDAEDLFGDDGKSFEDGGNRATAYADAITALLTFSLDRAADFNNSLTGWRPGNEKIMGMFNRQAIPMVWDFGEANIIENFVGGFITHVEYQSKCLGKLLPRGESYTRQMDAADNKIIDVVISTDPPYYDNVPYADLSDFFYGWMRKILKPIFPGVFSTLTVPKLNELVADPKRAGGKKEAETFFLNGMVKAMSAIANNSHPAYPITIYYAFKQADTKEKGTASTGWETFLEAVIESGLRITGTWPMRSEQGTRMRGIGANALASSIVLVCRRKDEDSISVTRREFQKELRNVMPDSIEQMLGGTLGASPIAPVDLAQSAIGPGMAIFSKYEAVLNQDGSKMSVHDALILINRAITDYLNPDSGNFDNDTLFCDDWFSQYGWGQGQFGEADTLARAKGTSVDGVRDAGVIESGGGKVRLLKWSEYPTDWDPKTDTRIPVWEACHQMIRVLNQQGEAEAGALLARMPERGEHIRQLAYHLYTLCERKKWAEEARAYNELIGSWHAIVAASHEVGHRGTQSELGLDF